MIKRAIRSEHSLSYSLKQIIFWMLQILQIFRNGKIWNNDCCGMAIIIVENSTIQPVQQLNK